METRKLGPSGLEVSLVGLGTNQFGGRLDVVAARKVIHKALDLGVTHFDTADIYGNSGGSETIIGAVLGSRRSQVTLATKFGKRMAGNPEQHRGSRAYVLAAVEASLIRLKTDTIDLLWMHEPDPSTPMEETFRALEELIKAGKVRHVGASNFEAAQLLDAAASAKVAGVEGFVAAQDEYSLLNRSHETGLFPAMETLKLSLVPYFPLSGGALSGKYRKEKAFPENTRLTEESRFVKPHWDTIEKLAAFAEARGHSLLELAMSWLACKPLTASIIAGATKPEQVEANAAAVAWKLSEEEMAEVDGIAG